MQKQKIMEPGSKSWHSKMEVCGEGKKKQLMSAPQYPGTPGVRPAGGGTLIGNPWGLDKGGEGKVITEGTAAWVELRS
jgi:hypothetical protein